MANRIQAKVLLFGLALGIIIAPVVILLSAHGRPDLDYPVIAASGAIAFAVRGRWELRGHWWFWVTVVAIVCLHVPLILFIPWKAGWIPAPITMLACLVDLAALFGIFGLVEKLMSGPVATSSNESE
uniref:Transmembrane protein n=1 Tax=mine drainage metagenome TaxID=410659 RepID=E6QP31_9ZZZZ